MIDICKDCTLYVLKKLGRTMLCAESYLGLLIYVFTHVRFSVTFARNLVNLSTNIELVKYTVPLARPAMRTLKRVRFAI